MAETDKARKKREAIAHMKAAGAKLDTAAYDYEQGRDVGAGRLRRPKPKMPPANPFDGPQ